MYATVRDGSRGIALTLLVAGFTVLPMAGCEQVEHEGGLFAPFPQGVSSHAVDVEPGETSAPDVEPTVEPDAATPQVVDTGGPPAVTPSGATDPVAVAAAAEPPVATDATGTAPPPGTTIEPTPMPATGTTPAGTNPPTAVVGVAAGSVPQTWTPATDAAVTADPSALTTTASAPAVSAPAVTPAVTPATGLPEPATPVADPGTPTAPVAATSSWNSGGVAASCGPNALAVSAPLAEIQLVAVLPNVTPPSAVVRFPGNTEVVVTVGDMLGLEGAKVVSVGADYLELTELTVGAPDRYTMVKHTLRLAP